MQLTPDMKLTFGGLLRGYRIRARLSQSELARRALTDHSYVNRLEAGNREPSPLIVRALATALDLSPLDRDRLLTAAGYAPADPLALALHAEPELLELVRLALDPTTPPAVRWHIRELARPVVALANSLATAAAREEAA